MGSGATVSNGRRTARQGRRRAEDRSSTRFFVGRSKLDTCAAVAARRTVGRPGDIMPPCCQNCIFARYLGDEVSHSSDSLRAYRGSRLVELRKSHRSAIQTLLVGK
jgi:hypothetical protein